MQLRFIEDDELRESLQVRLGRRRKSIGQLRMERCDSSCWFCYGGVAIWAVQEQPETELKAFIDKLVSTRAISRPDNNLERWDLHHCLELAADLNLVKKDTARFTRLIREYRELIHPGRVQRLQQTCNRATSAISALDRMTEDLESIK